MIFPNKDSSLLLIKCTPKYYKPFGSFIIIRHFILVKRFLKNCAIVFDKYGIIYHRIRVATPRHNGKEERQHRIDEARFYKKMRMYSLEDRRKQLERYNSRSNDIPKTCLNFRSPNEILADYLAII